MTITLVKPKTQVVWRSATPGPKSTGIPDPGLFDGYTVDIKTTMNNGDSHTITPDAGTIGGTANFTFTDNNCNLFLRADGKTRDWIIRCLCCYTPVAP